MKEEILKTLESLYQLTGAMLYAVKNDKDFPVEHDFNELKEINKNIQQLEHLLKKKP